MATTVWQVTAHDPLFVVVADLFDAYRQHYGANPAPEAVPAWLRGQLDADRLWIFAADVDGRPCGILTLSIVPASLTLRSVWMIRDLYVAPAARRSGLARALLSHVAVLARAQGAHRLSLQTEPHNTAARSLYTDLGFQPVTDLTQLALLL